jgi:Cu+-exporting ATPase
MATLERRKTMKRGLLYLIGIILLTPLFVVAEPQTVEMKIEGMTCSACSAVIKKKLSKICTEVSVDHKEGHGSCTYDDAKVKPEQVIDAVNGAGYKATLEEQPAAQ